MSGKSCKTGKTGKTSCQLFPFSSDFALLDRKSIFPPGNNTAIEIIKFSETLIVEECCNPFTPVTGGAVEKESTIFIDCIG